MSITIELPPEIEARVRAIPDLDQRVLDFLRRQAALQEERTQPPHGDRSADFLAWANRPRPRVGLRDAGRDAIYED